MRRAFAIALPLFLATVASATPEVIHVPEDFTTIQAAVTAATTFGDEIVIAAGTYPEKVTVQNKVGLTIRGKGKVVIDGTGQTESLRVQDSLFVTLKNLKLTGGSSDTASVFGGRQILWRDCTITGVGNATTFFMTGSAKEVSITGCTISGGQTGIFMTGTSHRLSDSTVKDTGGDAIAVLGDFHVVSNCKVTNAGGDGISIASFKSETNRAVITDNVVDGAGDDGIELDILAAGCVVRSNTVGGAVDNGISLVSTEDGNSVSANSVKNCTGSGIFLSTDGAVIEGNDVKKPGENGIEVAAGANGNMIARNTVSKATLFAFLIGGSDNVLIANLAKDSTGADVDDNGMDNVYVDNNFVPLLK